MTAPVSFISPLTITAAKITSSTAVSKLSTELDWNAATNYTVGTVVFRPTLGRRFENQVAGVNSTPPEDDQTRWYDLGVTNAMSMFDSEASTQSIAPGILTAVFRPGPINAIYLAGLVGQSLSVTVKDAPSGTIVYTHSGSLEKSQPADYWEYFFSPLRPRTDFLMTGLTPYANCEVTVSITNTDGVARCGMVSVGDLVSLVGIAEVGAKVKTKSYSRIEADARGATSIKKGRKARDVSITVTVPLDMADTLADSLDAVSDIPCVLMGTDMDSLRALRSFGLLSYDLTCRKTDAVFNLSLQGMI